ncbi:MAG: dethiobiotin synthase [Mariprofundus sp.]
MARTIFITATDTDAGKTWVTAAAVRSLIDAGVDALAVKPVACGMDGAGRNDDIEALLAAQSLEDADAINCYCFALPATPSQAAAAEGDVIEPEHLLQWCSEHAGGVCLIEGVGGLMAPLTDAWLVSDWIEAMPACDVWLVVGCRLGAINHTLLSLDKLQTIGCAPGYVILNAVSQADERWLEPTRQAVSPYLPAGCSVQQLKHGELFVAGSELLG